MFLLIHIVFIVYSYVFKFHILYTQFVEIIKTTINIYYIFSNYTK